MLKMKPQLQWQSVKSPWPLVKRIIVSLSITGAVYLVFKFKPTQLASICVPVVTM